MPTLYSATQLCARHAHLRNPIAVTSSLPRGLAPAFALISPPFVWGLWHPSKRKVGIPTFFLVLGGKLGPAELGIPYRDGGEHEKSTRFGWGHVVVCRPGARGGLGKEGAAAAGRARLSVRLGRVLYRH